MKIVKRTHIQRSAQAVWQLIAHDFDKAYLWMGPIPHSYDIGKGQSHLGAPMEGRICHLSDNPNGAKAKEIITHYDEAQMSLTFEITSINVPAIVPVKKNTVQMTVKATAHNRCEVIWIAQPELKTPAYLAYPLLRMALPLAFGKLLSGLKQYAERNISTQASMA